MSALSLSGRLSATVATPSATVNVEVLPLLGQRRARAERAHRRATILDIEVREQCQVCCRARIGWPRERVLEPEDRDARARPQLEALQLAKLRRQIAWATARSPWYRRSRWPAFDPDALQSLDDLRSAPDAHARGLDGLAVRAPALRRAARRSRGAGAIRVHTTSGTTGKGPLRALDSRKDWAWIAEMWAYGDLGLRRAAGRHRLHRVRLRLVHRLLGPALLDGEDRGAQRPRRRADDRGAGPPDRRLRRHRRRLDAHLRAAPGPGGARPRASTCPARRCSG